MILKRLKLLLSSVTLTFISPVTATVRLTHPIRSVELLSQSVLSNLTSVSRLTVTRLLTLQALRRLLILSAELHSTLTMMRLRILTGSYILTTRPTSVIFLRKKTVRLSLQVSRRFGMLVTEVTRESSPVTTGQEQAVRESFSKQYLMI